MIIPPKKTQRIGTKRTQLDGRTNDMKYVHSSLPYETKSEKTAGSWFFKMPIGGQPHIKIV